MTLITGLLLICLGLAGWLILRAAYSAHQTDWKNPFLNILDGLNRLFCRYYHHLHAPVLALPSQGAVLIVANHVSGLDPLLLYAVTNRPLRFLIDAHQYHRVGLTWLFRAIGGIPVDYSGRPEKALKVALQALEAGEAVAIFPQGGFVLPTQFPSKLKRGAFWLAQHTKTPIYPVHITGVKGMGYAVRGVFIRSRVQLTAYPPVYCTSEEEITTCATTVQALFENPAITAQKVE
ncbi:1-acyl-sn-glycerol-3-phosphate acyltransferase [Beggiatoa alba B18LD]|uniref:1-acyl-sn-glycerol-3-phosphate acyltransferase n=1 Tax=Beggiatoa alba B18LD TaxID=395493 RepID=I3CIV2_9GAMM|nr:lysophospholipid acyltransferase family protein [Beggiatoa alba]EIJ43545.1 1-acyl-sn-glycerol-3-phosphate acyltransferase [Beggiatoa alba B18LD]